LAASEAVIASPFINRKRQVAFEKNRTKTRRRQFASESNRAFRKKKKINKKNLFLLFQSLIFFPGSYLTL